MSSEVVVVIGVGGMGRAVARRQGAGRTVLLADHNESVLDSAAEALAEDGHEVRARQVDVTDGESVSELAADAAKLGRVTQVVHTAGLSPVQAPVAAILRVDLLGVALVLDAFGEVMAPGGAGVVMSSMAGHLAGALPPDQETALAQTPSDELLSLPFLSASTVTDPAQAYCLAKRANQLRVRAASTVWGDRGARVNSISPGVISTAMGREELASEAGGFMRAMVDASGTRRLGSPDDIAAVTAYLLGPDASFITGADLLVDGGALAGLLSGRVKASD
ncbi:SDR family oxidoreductase [Streptomyces spinoverrucosus]|uniref:SDR family oxidoreductase n=1 Tax=Streptomyces spinoverrucosus TaxID=284043 RepID=UPI0018C3F6CF|nr:SDR family oxidoreductase [Streptomyces spinoverrucosus]MBG0855750.1 SDR family oxidoreductase [Streptomyces spinoverrucosus]